MPLVRFQEDELHINSDLHATSIARWRVSTPHSQHSHNLRSSLKPPSLNPRFPRKATSWTTVTPRVVRLDMIQEDEDDGGSPTYQPRLPQFPMETNIDEVNTDAYTRSARPSPDGFDKVHPTVLNSPTHDLVNPFRCTFDDPENVLYQHRRDPRNIVLDSLRPEIAPHIVITPPEFDWTDFSTMHANTVPPQQYPEYYLCVPGSSPKSLLATIPPKETAGREIQAKIFDANSEELENGSRVDDTVSDNGSQPMRVFSPSLFVKTIEAASQERELINNLLRPLYKRLFSTCAAAASDIARSLQSRHSSSVIISGLFSRLEMPATWSDPALPLLSWFFRLPGALIIDSVTPFTIPHIVITEPPIWDYNLYVNVHNSTQSPQDAGWGQSLVVPSPVVDFVNLPEDVPFESTDAAYDIVIQCVESGTEGDWSEPECPSEGSVVGSPESTALQTPGLLTPIGEEEEFDLVMFASSPPPTSSHLTPVGGDELLVLEAAPQDFETYCDDEDDDLPPLDDWYQDIASRSGYVLST